jgi:glyoxylase-like metal-dependent hydrolase (beta-lactamase superfamily II)
VVTFADQDGTLIALFFDAGTRRLTKSETLGDHPIFGDTVSEVVYLDYRTVAGVQVPFRVVGRTAGEDVSDIAYTEIRVNTAPADALFEAPAAAIPGSPVGPAAAVTVQKLGDGVYLLDGSSHHSLVVVLADGIVVVDGPQSEERSQAVLARLQELAPGRPVKTLVMTHHHFDHTGGLRAYIARGATILTTPGNRALVERIAGAPHTIRPDALARAPRPPVVETFAGRKVITDGTRTLELHDVGPNPHADEILVAYLPREKVLFQSDLVNLPAAGPLPGASPATHALVGKLKTLGLEVETVTGGHGRVATMDEIAPTLTQKSN